MNMSCSATLLQMRLPMNSVDFINVGYANACFTVEFSGELTEQFIIDNALPHCGSRNLSALVDEEHTEGLILGGVRTIGQFKVRYSE